MMINFLEIAKNEIDAGLMRYYRDDLSDFQRDYLFPGALKRALDAYIASGNFKTDGLAVYQALFNTNFLLKTYPWGFGYLDIFSDMYFRPATQACYLAFVDNKLSTDDKEVNQVNFCAIQLNDYENDIRLLQAYNHAPSLFKTLFFPSALANALTEYQAGGDPRPIYDAYSKATSNIFSYIVLSFLLPGIDRFKRTALAQAYDDIAVKDSFADDLKQDIFNTLKNSQVPYMTNYCIQEFEQNGFLSEEGPVKKACLEAAKNYASEQDTKYHPYGGITQRILQLKREGVLTELTIPAIVEYPRKWLDCIEGFQRLQTKNLLTQPCIDILKKHETPEEAADALILIHHLQLDLPIEQACFDAISRHSFNPHQDPGYFREVRQQQEKANLVQLTKTLEKLPVDNLTSSDLALFIANHSAELFNKTTNKHWSAIHSQAFTKDLFERLAAICETSSDNSAKEIMAVLKEYKSEEETTKEQASAFIRSPASTGDLPSFFEQPNTGRVEETPKVPNLS